MNIFDLQATISLNGDAFMNGVQEAQGAFSGLGDTIKGTAIGKLAADAVEKGASAVMDFGKAAMQTGMSFDASMANVAAISGATAEDVENLRDKAKEMGATTKFTASQAADAFSYMAMAGWDAGQMMDGITGIMNLAAASGEDLATTSDIVTDALTAFGLKAEDSGHFADVLAAASSAANTNVSMMGETFKYVAPLAGTMGYSVEDMATAIGTMANSGIKGSQAGTALRSAITRLVKPTKEVYTALNQLGLEGGAITNADGSMMSFSETVDVLRDAFSGLDEADQAMYAGMIFGQEAMSGMLAIINSAPEEYDALAETIGAASDAMGGMGTAAEMAAVQLDNLPGQVTILQSALDGFKTAIYEKIKDPLRELAAIGSDVFSQLTAAVNEGGVMGAFEALGGILSGVIGPKFAELADKILPGVQDGFSNLIGAFQPFVDVVTGAFSEAMPVATGAVEDFARAVGESGLAETLRNVATGAKSLFDAFISEGAQNVGAVARSVADFLSGFTAGGGNDALAGVAKSAGTFFNDFLIASNTTIKAVGDGTRAFLKGFDEYKVGEAVAELAAASEELFGAVASTSGAALKDVAAGVDALVHAGGDKIESAGRGASSLAAAFAELGAKITSGFADTISSVGDAFKGMGEKLGGIIGTFGPDVGRLGEALADFVGIATDFGVKIRDTFAPVGEWLNKFLVQALQAALSMVVGVVGAIIDAVTPIAEFFNATLHFAIDVFKGDWQSAWDDAKAAGRAFADFVEGLGDIIIRPFQAIIPQMVQIGSDIINGLWNGLKGMWDSVSGWFENTVGGLVSGVKNLLGIGSPSKVFAEIGKFTVQGMEVGWRSEFGRLENQVGRDISSLTGTTRIGFEDSAIGRSSAAGISSMFAANETSGRGDPVAINLILDGDVAATALYDPLRRTAFQKGQGKEAAYA